MRDQLLGDRYRILERIGEGGMAYVYVAIDEKLGRRVAVKVLHEHMERNADIRKRFQLEAQAVSSLEHPNIVKVYDFAGESAPRLWIVTEVIRGKNLAQYVQQNSAGWLNPIIALAIVREILKALDKAHSHLVVHRDIKPENIMLTSDGRVKLMDFGIAKDLGKNGMTVTGTFMGSPSYMSPEQIRGRGVDHRSDLYSLSVLFYEIVTGRLPFTGQTTHDVVLKIIDGSFTHPCYIVPSLPTRINETIIRGMAKSPEARFQSARDYGAELDQNLKDLGFDESHIELERFFKDPRAFEERLAKSLNRTEHVPGHRVPTPRLATERLTAQLQSALHPNQLSTSTRSKLAVAKVRGETERSGAKNTRTARPEPPTPLAPTKQQTVSYKPPAEPPQRPNAPGSMAHSAIDPGRARPAPQAGQVARGGSPAGQVPRGGVQRPPKRPQARRPRPEAPRQSNWLTHIFGVALVGIIGMVSLWGFLELEKRLASHPGRKPLTRPPASSSGPTKSSAQSGPRVIERRVDPTLASLTKPRVSSSGQVKPATGPSVQEGRSPNSSPGHKERQAQASSKPTTKIPETGKPAEMVEAKVQPLSPRAKVSAALEAPRRNPPPNPETSPTLTPNMSKGEASKPEPSIQPEASDAGLDLKASAPQSPTKAKTGKAQFRISSEPAAEVFIDGQRLATTVDQTTSSGWLPATTGHHSLELRRQGYATHKTKLELAPGDRKSLALVTLVPKQEQSAGETQLTIQLSVSPAQVTILNLTSGATQVFTQKIAAKTLFLPSGRYHLKVEYQGEIREREFDLSGGPVTFTGDFKKQASQGQPSGDPGSDD